AKVRVSIRKVLSVSVNFHYAITPRKSYYERLEADEFWTYVGNYVSNKIRSIG
ncbi:hypothetical protein EZS27_025714, partial [termite gut metagenome]